MAVKIMIEAYERVINIWLRNQIPESLKALCGDDPEWIALLPPATVCLELESLFLRWETNLAHIKRQTLEDGSVLLSSTGEKSLSSAS
jgi:hypothetical protein